MKEPEFADLYLFSRPTQFVAHVPAFVFKSLSADDLITFRAFKEDREIFAGYTVIEKNVQIFDSGEVKYHIFVEKTTE